MARIKIEDIQHELELFGWEVVSTKYQNLQQELHFRCQDGHDVYAPWGKIREQRVCPICMEGILQNQDKKIIKRPKKGNRVAGIDQSTKVTGWSVFDDGELVQYGAFVYQKGDVEERINAHKHWLINFLYTWEPDFVGIEDIQSQEAGGYKTFKTLANLQGVFIDTLYEQKIPFGVYPATVWRKLSQVKGRSRADQKISMQTRAKEFYGVTATNDEADAIGIGRYACYKQPRKEQKRIF